ncbi:hypothetical protein CORC01_07605 [Colletotrichum orchidophilum]|uniref:Uncharacterized protein n=1 Tax=Colletotrichum orchidophilum TaxID=1209926 RepID=A0A1G4B6Z1_9PEZI|nr:uncharacterized protein CORC01_07605 [Colletotrichum orchidophilum]OHE97164.1 hypothetical protein CORC01_07605 [Colletotrichum orchidophilum]
MYAMIAMATPTLNSEVIPMKSRVCHKFYEPLVLLKALNVEMTNLAEFVDPDDLNYRGDAKKIFKAFLYKLAHVCDSMPGNGGGTVTSVMLLRGADGTNVEYRFASNQRNEEDLQDVAAFMRFLLERTGRESTLVDAPNLRKDLLNAVLWFNRLRISFYIGRLEKEIQNCLANSQDDVRNCNILLHDLITLKASEAWAYIDQRARNIRLSGGTSISSSCWPEMRHMVNRLLAYCKDVEFFILAKENWPEIFRSFTITACPSSQPLPRPGRNKSMTAESIVGRMTRKEFSIEKFRALVNSLQMVHLDERIQAEYKKDNFHPIVHSEILLLNNLEKTVGGISPGRFFNEWMYIGSSKPTCRLCEYYFEEHRSGVEHRSSHKNLYISWRVPDVLQSEGDEGEEKREIMINRLLQRIRKDAFDLVEKKVRPTFRNHDSLTSSVRMTLRGRWSETFDTSDVTSQMGSLGLNDGGDDEVGGVSLSIRKSSLQLVHLMVIDPARVSGDGRERRNFCVHNVLTSSQLVKSTFITTIKCGADSNLISHAMAQSHVVKLYIGPMRFYFVQGGESVQAMFRSSASISSNKFILLVMKNLQGSAEEDVAKFANDKSGRLKIPAQGYENMPQEKRYWYNLHHITIENLSRSEPCALLAETYTKFLGDALEKQPLGQWATVRLFDLLRKDMCESAIKSLCGPKLLEMFPDYVDQFWRFESVAFQVVYGLPKWINRKPVEERDKLNGMTQKYLEAAFSTLDWDGPGTESAWEPVFGSIYMRKISKWLHDAGMAMETKAGFHMIAIFGINANTIPIATWVLIELLRDPELFRAVRDEAHQTLHIDPVTGKRSFDVPKLISMPLMQSIFTECMRLHVSIAISREIVKTTTLQGFRLKKGSMIQAPTNLVHLDEQIWSQEGHAASEFWAERHIKHVTQVEESTGQQTTQRQFVMAGKPSEFFPFGRFFAKQEVLLTIAMLVTKFDMEFVEWTTLSGLKSDRAPVDDERYFGTAAVPPDRDVKVRWKRLW